MKLRIFVACIVMMIPLCMLSQKHMKFMGIPIDGNAYSFCQKLEEKGFLMDRDGGNESMDVCSFIGKFYGEDAHIDVEYTHDTHIVYSVTVSIIKSSALSLYSIQRDYLRAVEEKYKYEKNTLDPQLYKYDYYIYDGYDPVGMIQTFIVSPDTFQSMTEAMLSITYLDVENYMNYEKRKRNDI